jgi:hypothetical protein
MANQNQFDQWHQSDHYEINNLFQSDLARGVQVGSQAEVAEPSREWLIGTLSDRDRSRLYKKNAAPSAADDAHQITAIRNGGRLTRLARVQSSLDVQ